MKIICNRDVKDWHVYHMSDMNKRKILNIVYNELKKLKFDKKANYYVELDKNEWIIEICRYGIFAHKKNHDEPYYGIFKADKTIHNIKISTFNCVDEMKDLISIKGLGSFFPWINLNERLIASEAYGDERYAKASFILNKILNNIVENSIKNETKSYI